MDGRNSTDPVVRNPQRVAAVRGADLLDTPPEESFDRLTRLAVRLLGVPAAFVSLVDEHRDFYKSQCGFGEPVATVRELTGTTLCHFALSGAGPLVIPDTRADPVFRSVPTVDSLGVAAYVGIPLRTAEGEAIGSFCAIDFRPRDWTGAELEVLAELACSTEREIQLRLARRDSDLHTRETQALADNLQESEERFRKLVERSPDAVSVHVEGRFVFVNQATIRLLGASSSADLIGRPVLEFVHPEYRARVLRRAQEMLATGEPAPVIEECFLRADGSKIYGEVASTPTVYSGSPAIQVVVRDTSERRRAAAEIRLQQAYLEQLFESAPEGIVLVDPEDRVVRVNSEFVRMFGYAQEEVAGRPLNSLIVPGGAHAEATSITRRAFDGDTVRIEAVRQRKDGSRLHVSILATPVSADGESAAVYGIYRDIGEQKALEERLVLNALHDSLTGLPNRALLMNRLEQAARRMQRSRSPYALLFLDLDRLKHVNDTRGHSVGDALLVAVTHRLRTAVRAGDTIARISGDEFVVLLEDLESPDVAVQVAERIRGSLESPFALEGHELFASASVGVAVSASAESDPAQVLREADLAMYRAKAAGRGRYAVFDASVDTETVSRMHLEQDLRRAVGAGEFRCHYQPIVDLRTGRVSAVEALVRWAHPTRGLIGPGDFIPLAEEIDLVGAIGDWVLQEATSQIRRWERDGVVDGSMCVSVNISARDLAVGFPARVRQILGRSGLAPARLVLEITEGAVVRSTDTTRGVMRELKRAGVRLAIDDFGTGYSALSYLGRLPFDVLKIDQSFVTALQDEGARGPLLIEGIINLARSLKLEVVAEGIELPSQRQQLAAWNCDKGQGYGIAQPAAAEEIAGFLARGA